MRTTLLLLTLAALLSACAGADGDAGGGGETPDAVESTTTEHAREAVPLASKALAATKVEMFTQWQSCMAISWKYEAFGTITAPEGRPAEQLEAVRAVLTGAGYDDVTQVDGHVTAERDGTTVDVQQPTVVRGPEVWQVSVSSTCADYDGTDLERVEDDEPRPLDVPSP
jgi:hypothetical protein